MNFNKSLSFLITLIDLPLNRRAHFLKLCQLFVIDDFNILLTNLKLVNLSKFDKTIVSKIRDSKSLRKKRRIILQQNGSFLSRILPYILGEYKYLVLKNHDIYNIDKDAPKKISKKTKISKMNTEDATNDNSNI